MLRMSVISSDGFGFRGLRIGNGSTKSKKDCKEECVYESVRDLLLVQRRDHKSR